MKASASLATRPTRTRMSTDRFGCNDADDWLTVAVARLAFELAFPTETAGTNVRDLSER